MIDNNIKYTVCRKVLDNPHELMSTHSLEEAREYIKQLVRVFTNDVFILFKYTTTREMLKWECERDTVFKMENRWASDSDSLTEEERDVLSEINRRDV